MAKPIVYSNIGELMTLKGAARKKGRKVLAQDLNILRQAAMVVESGKIQWIGKQKDLPTSFKKNQKIDCKGQNIFPGFVDCHTHMIFAGDRKNEFELRNCGMSYQEIAKRGGGILSTMKATRKASLDELIQLGQERVENHLAQGVTSIEVKSGYGLNRKSEMKMLRAAKSLKKANVVTTFLGAHAIPKGSTEKSYLDSLKKDLLEVKKNSLSQRVDIFIEKHYFTTGLGKEYLMFAQELGFDITIHADQLSRTGASSLAVDVGALSADHAICLTVKDRQKIAASETVAVLLPCADFYLQCDYPKARDLIDQGACVAIATDFNPGSSPTQNISLLGVLSRLEMKMTLPEVFVALTYGGAKALKLDKECGSLEIGKRADFFVSNRSWKDFFYDMSPVSVVATFVNGRKVFGRL